MKIVVGITLYHASGQEAGQVSTHQELYPHNKETLANAASAMVGHLTSSEEFPRLFQRALAVVPMIGGIAHGAQELQEQINAKIGRELAKRESELHFKVMGAIRDFGLAVQEHIELYEPLRAEINALIGAAHAYTVHKTGREAGLDQILGLIEYINSFQPPNDRNAAISHLSALYQLFESANRAMERRGFQGYRLTPPYHAIRQFLAHENRLPAPPMEDSPHDRMAWESTWKAPEAKPTIRAGDQITVNPLGAALLSVGKDRGMIMVDINAEREKQVMGGYDPQHDASHDRNTWIAILAQEIGQAAFVPDDQYRRALVKTAAVAVAALEAYDEEHT